MKILAIDPATKCGWAVNEPQASGTWNLSVRRDESDGMRLIRLESKLAAIDEAGGIDLVVFEAARHGAPKMQGALVVQAQFQGVLKAWCLRRQIPYRAYSPTEIKKHATGRGNANKDAVLLAARDRWPGCKDDNEADALWLLDLASEEYGDG